MERYTLEFREAAPLSPEGWYILDHEAKVAGLWPNYHQAQETCFELNNGDTDPDIWFWSYDYTRPAS